MTYDNLLRLIDDPDVRDPLKFLREREIVHYRRFADALGIGGKSKGEKFNNFIAAIRALQKRVGIKPTIRDYVPDEKDFLARLDDMVEQAFDDQCTGANPRYPLMSEIKQMYLNAYYGKHTAV